MKIALIFCLLFCLFCSCNKDVNIKVEGAIMDSVTKAPIGNTAFILEVEKYEGMKMQMRPTNFTTKPDGTFSVSCSASAGSGAYIIFASANSNISALQAIWTSKNSTGQQTYFNAGVIYTQK